MAGLFTFDFVREDGPKPEDLLILGETTARESPDGKRVTRPDLGIQSVPRMNLCNSRRSVLAWAKFMLFCLVAGRAR